MGTTRGRSTRIMGMFLENPKKYRGIYREGRCVSLFKVDEIGNCLFLPHHRLSLNNTKIMVYDGDFSSEVGLKLPVGRAFCAVAHGFV